MTPRFQVGAEVTLSGVPCTVYAVRTVMDYDARGTTVRHLYKVTGYLLLCSMADRHWYNQSSLRLVSDLSPYLTPHHFQD